MMIVVKIGGDLLSDGLPSSICDEIADLRESNRLILVHGGGGIVTEISEKLEHPPRFVTSPRGFTSRYTDKATSEIFTMVMSGKINKEIVCKLNSHGLNAIGLTGLDAGLVKAKRKKHLIIKDERGRRRLIEGGYTGKITEVNTVLLESLLEKGYTPVISPVAMGGSFEPLNVDGDRMAASVASQMKADRLVLLTDVEGVYYRDKLLDETNIHMAKELVDEMGSGMVTKVYAGIEAIEGGVGLVIISSGLNESPISSAIQEFTGTVIYR